MSLQFIKTHELKKTHSYYECFCKAVFAANKYDVKYGKIVSCGCKKKLVAKTANLKHGHCRSKTGKESPTFNSWRCMFARCYNKSNHNYKYYGARGIQVCKEWNEFTEFLKDMGERPKNYTLDRINVNGNYEPSNCKWSTHREQANNRRRKSAKT